MGCGSSKKVNQADELRNFALANHLYSILGITPVSEDVERYVTRLRSQGFDSPEDLDKLTIAALDAGPFFFKKGHLLRVEESRKNKELEEPDTLKEVDANGKRPTINQMNDRATDGDAEENTALAAHLSAILGIKRPSAVVSSYVTQLCSDGCDSPQDLDDLTIDELAGDPFNFKRLHLKKVSVRLCLRPLVCVCVLYTVKCFREQTVNNQIVCSWKGKGLVHISCWCAFKVVSCV